MFTREELLYWSDCIYRTFLSLYPARFRRHFGTEMAQIFRDCCRSEAETGKLSGLWLRTLKDLSLSVPTEWRREMERPDSEFDYTGLVDTFMITLVVGTNLIGWGCLGAAAMLHWTLPGIMEYWNTAATILFGIVTLPMAGLIGTIFALLVARIGRSELPHIKV
jgi:hypothetical protein